MQVGLKIDEIIDFDLKAENFSVVGTLPMQWRQDRLAYDPKKGKQTIRAFDWDDFIEYATKLQVRIPHFIWI